MAKVRKAELSFLYGTRHLILFYISTKYHQNIPKGIRVTEQTRNFFQIKQRVITPKVRQPELSILYAPRHLVLIYISTKYHQHIPKGNQVTEQTRSFTQMRTPAKPSQKQYGGGGGGGGVWGGDIKSTDSKKVLSVFSLRKRYNKHIVFSLKIRLSRVAGR